MIFPCKPYRYAGPVRLFLTTLLAVGLNVPTVTNAQTPGISGVNVVFQHLSTEQGLSNNAAWAITQDKQGFIWIGTENGLNRYDGKHCLVYYAGKDSTGLSDNFIWSLFSDRDSTLWIGTNHGLNRFDPRTLTFKKYFHDSANTASLSHDEVHPIYRDRSGTLWVGTKRGLDRFNPVSDSWTHFLPNDADSTRPGDNFIMAIFEDNEGALWIEAGNYAMHGGGIFQFDRVLGTFARIESLSAKDYSVGFVASRSDDVSGNLWVCSSNRYGQELSDQWAGVFQSLYSSESRRRLTSPERAKSLTTRYRLFSVCEDKHGAIWGLGNSGIWLTGLIRHETRSGGRVRYGDDSERPGSLSSPNVKVLFIDRAGLLWIGTGDEGVNTVSTKPFLFRHSLGDSLRISNPSGLTFTDRQGNLWIGSLRFDVGTQRARYVLRELFGVTDLCQDIDGTIWATDPFDLARYIPGTDNAERVWRLPYAGLDEVATRVFVDSRRFFWIGTQGGVYRLRRDLSNYTRFNLDPEGVGGILGGRVTSIYEDKLGSVWVGSETGLYQFQKGEESFRRFVHDDRDSTSLSSNQCTGILEDVLGNVWVSTAKGLDKFDPTRQAFQTHLREPVGRIVADRIGRFWFGSAGSPFGLAGKISTYDPVSRQLNTFDESDGLPGQEVYGWPHTMRKSGELVFGTNKGFVVFHPDSVRKLTYVPPVIITGITMFDKPVPLNTSPELLREITFEHDENVLSISYAALSYDMPGYNQYAYKLEGFDKDWVSCGNKQEVTFTNLDPGQYTFRVKGSNHNGVWNEAGTSLAIVIRPAYWQTWWFKSLMILAMVGLGGSVAGYAERLRAKRKIERLEREHALERERARISQDMHDEVGSSLSEIAILSELVKKDLRKPEAAEVQVQQISDRAAELIDNVSEIVWAMNPKNDTLENLLGHIRRYAVKYLELAGIACEFHAPEMIPPVPVPSEIRRNLFLVVKEVLHNVVKHAHASAVCIDVSLNGDMLGMRIKDNGRGFTIEDQRDTGNGLASMCKRMADIGGTCTIQSTPDNGTEILLTAVPQKSR